jgi:hypothetical protein
VIATKIAREAWHRLSPETPVQTATRGLPQLGLPQLGRQGLVRSGVAAGATLVALSAASAVTTVIRRRVEGSGS